MRNLTRRYSALPLMVVCFCAMAAYAEGAFPKAAEWPCDMRTGARLGLSPLKGRIESPRVAWQYDAATVMAVASLKPEPGAQDHPVAMDTAGLPQSLPDAARWYPPARDVLLEGKPQPRPENISERVLADIFPKMPGLEKVQYEMRSVAQYEKEFRLVCRGWQDGAWQVRWQSKWRPGGNSVATGLLAGDYDHDGRLEIAVLPWYALYIFDAATGRLEHRCEFTPGRCYGYFGAHDLNGDGLWEFVVLADFAKHVDVLGFQKGRLTLLWKQEIELNIEDPAIILRVRPDCVADVDGDGVSEVIWSGYNERGDGRWHTVARDGMTGAVKAQLDEAFFEAAEDVDGDGRVELLTTDTKGAAIAQCGPIRVWKWHAGSGPECVWQCEDAAWEHHRAPVSEQVYAGATLGQETVLGRSTARGYVAAYRAGMCQEAGQRLQPRLWLARWDNGFHTEAGVMGPLVSGLAIDDSGTLLFQSRAADAVIAQGNVELLTAKSAGVSVSPPAVVWPDGETRPIVAARGSGEEIVLFRPPCGGQPVELVRRVAGRVQDTSFEGANSPGPVVADLGGDGRRALLYAKSAPTGSVRFVAEDVVTGQEIWHHDFPDIPGGAPIWNVGGILLWQAGHFLDPVRMDVLVTVRRSMMHSEETALLSGQDGRECWRQRRQANESQNRGVGGTPFGLVDCDGDGLDDAATFYPSLHYVLEGETGETLLKRDTSWPPVKDNPVYWGRPVVVPDMPGLDSMPYLFMAGADLTALVDKAGQLVWSDESGKGLGLFGFGDFDGDGALEAIGTGFPDGWRCYDVRTGAIEWRMTAPVSGAVAGIASADVNGDGRCDLVAACGATLCAVTTATDNNAGRVLWQWEGKDALGPPIVADIEGKGEASVLVADRTGMVYALH